METSQKMGCTVDTAQPFKLIALGEEYQAMKRPLSTSMLPVPTDGSWTS